MKLKIKLSLKTRIRSLLHRYRKSISVQLLSAVLIVSSAVTFVTTGIQLGLDYRDALSGLQDDLDFIEKGYSTGITQSLWEMNSPQIQAALRGLLHIPGVKYAEITEGEKLIFSAGKPPSGKTLTRSFSLNYQNHGEVVQLGQMRVIASLNHIFVTLQKTLFYIFFFQFIKTLIVSTLVLLIIRHILIRHLIVITDYLRSLEFSSDTSDLRLTRNKNTPSHSHSPSHCEDELDILVGAINRMRANLHQSYEKLNDFNQQLEHKVEKRTELLLESQRIITEQQKALIASAKLSALGEMAGGIAHEINNPLSAIQNLSSLMNRVLTEREFEKAELEKMLISMTSLTERIAGIIQGLRDFSRDASQDPIHPIEVRHLIELTMNFCAERFRANDIALIIDPLPQGLSIACRETELSQVLLNLLSNSFDAVLDHSNERLEKWIRISVSENDSQVEIRVTDSGLGISPEIQKKLFQPFFTTKEVGKGTGLGLSIAFGILKANQGELFLDEQSRYTSFVIRLPKLPAAKTNEISETEEAIR
jgi:signal transduction histidine kinase